MTASHKGHISKDLAHLNRRIRRQGNIAVIFRKSTAARKYAVRTAQAVMSGKRENMQIVNAIDAVVCKMEAIELRNLNRRISAIGDTAFKTISKASRGKYSESVVRESLCIKGKAAINIDVMDLATEFIRIWDVTHSQVARAMHIPLSKQKFTKQC